MNPWRSLGDLPKGIWVLFTTILINRAGTMVLPFMVLYLTEGLGFSAGHASLVITVYGVGALVTGPISGRLCDLVGPLRIMKVSLLISGTVLLLFPLAKNFVAILALTIIWSVISEAFRPASLAITTDLVSPEQRKSAFAFIRLAINLGMSIGPVVGGILATFSFPSLFWVDGGTCILAGIVLSILPMRIERRIDTNEVKKSETTGLAGRLSSLFVDSHLRYFLIAVVPVTIVFFQHINGMPLFLVRDLRLSESVYGLLFTLNTVLIIFLEVPLNMAMVNWSHRRTLMLGSFLFSVGFGALAFANGILSVAATVVIWTFGEMILLPATSAYMADIAPAEKRGEYMGLYTMSFSLAYIGSSIGPVVLEKFGAPVLWTAAFIFGSLSTVMMGRVYLKQSEEPRRAEGLRALRG
jgi:predicted MFS family arabinose efflux permease